MRAHLADEHDPRSVSSRAEAPDDRRSHQDDERDHSTRRRHALAERAARALTAFATHSVTVSASYTDAQPFAEGRGTTLYHALRVSDGRPVILKVLDPQRSRPRDLEQLQHEYALSSALDLPAVVKPLALDTYQGMPALVMEDFGGCSLDELLGPPMAVDRFLGLAIAIAEAAAQLHGLGVVHKDLKPHNILVNLATSEVKIADLGLASRLPREQQAPQPARLIEGSLPYLSPEQTGRTHRAVDRRADLYALGVTFFEMLTGRLPFEARDPLSWIHCHVACAPPSPSEVVAAVPETLARIVVRLLSKTPEDRYQSASGLRRDLERCLAAWTEIEEIEPFALGEQDAFDGLQIPQKLYGREAEIALLCAAFDRVVEGGAPELLLASGDSGIGKSALVGELQGPIARERALFLSGKFDQHERDVPCSALVRAFGELVLEILAESEDQIAAWRQRLLDTLGVHAGVVAEAIPSVELVIGRQPPAPELPPIEAQRRFRRVLSRFIGVFASEDHPVVVFLDDLQWADAASLGLIEELLTRGDARHLLVVGAQRGAEVPGSHPLSQVVDAVRQAGTRVSEVLLGPLGPEPFAGFVRDVLRCRLEDATPLAELVRDKTAGNPFFATQFLLSLHEDGLIAFDRGARAFRWDTGRIRERRCTDNVVDLMVDKLRRLPEATQRALQQLACLGRDAEVALLAMIRGGTEQEIHADLGEASRAGLVVSTGGAYRFLHDRFQEAAYALIPEGERPALHLGIGRRLASPPDPAYLEEKIFAIVNQLDRGAALIASPEERERTAELNLVAGKRAKASTAYAAALTYFAAGASLLEEDHFIRRYDLAFALEMQRAECEYLTGELAAAEARLSVLWGRARHLVDAAAVARAQLVLYSRQGRHDVAIEAGLRYLRRIGLSFPARPAAEEARQEYERLLRGLGSRSIEDLVDLRPMADPGWCATMDVLMEIVAPALFTDQSLTCFTVCRMANLSLEHGNSDVSCVAYAWLGMLLGPCFGDYQAGLRFGKLALELVDRRGLYRFRARVYATVGNLVNPWTRPLREGIDLARRAFELSLETGDLAFAAYTCSCTTAILLAMGTPLGEVQREAEGALDFIRKAGFGLVADNVTSQVRLVRALRGLSAGLSSFDDAEFDEGRFEQHLTSDPQLALATCWYWIRKLEAHYFAGEHAAAVAAAAQAAPLLWTSPSFFEIAEYHFYGALARAARCDAAPEDERAAHLAQLAAHHRQIEAWAQSCPENFGGRAALVAAEIARVEGRDLDAMHLYEEAIRAAGDEGLVHDEAVTYETAARLYRRRGFGLTADTYLREARARYLRWGADGKARQIERDHPHLFEVKPVALAATFVAPTEQIDLYSVAKASQTISGEIVLDKLLRTLLEVVLEQGGARRACLVRCREGVLSIEAEAALAAGPTVTTVIESSPLDAAPRVAASIVKYAHRTRERVILHDAAACPGKFSGDRYLARRRMRSILCLPILRQAEVIGLIYLENDLLPGAFTPDRLTALELLATQAAISLENALLVARERAARAAAEDAEHRAAFLAEAGALLAESLAYEETFARLTRLCVRGLATWCVIDVLEGDEIQRLAMAHADPAKERLLADLERRYPNGATSLDPAATAIRTGEPLLMPELPDERVWPTRDDDHRRLLGELGARTGLVMPLTARGRTLGAITLCSAAPGRRYGRADVDLAVELARRAAVAIDNGRLYRASQEACRARSEFLTVASHELNTPMTSLSLAVASLRRAAPSGRLAQPEVLGRQLDLVSRQASRLTRLINDLLDVSRIEAGRLSIERADVELGVLVREVVTRFEGDLARARCPVSIDEVSPVVGQWDRSRLDRVVTNLLSNAIKFGAGAPIEIAVGADRGVARIVVRDHGIGVAPEQQARIFGRFERAVSERHYGGLGLGLYICRKIVEDHGGSIGVQSLAGDGSTFTVELPLAAPS
jgi:predicted ATPase/signal transduction histidine kinase